MTLDVMTRRNGRIRWATWSALAGIAALSALGLWLLSHLLADTYQRRTLNEYQSSTRTTQNLLLDLVRIEIAIDRMVANGAESASARDEVIFAADLMLARVDSFWKYIDVESGDHVQLISERRNVELAVDAVIKSIDRFLGDKENTNVIATRPDLGNAISALIQFTEERQIHYSRTLREREDEFRRLIIGTLALFVVFAAIATLAVLLWQREILARERRREAEEEARFLAYHDPMTRLANRSLFNLELARTLASHDAPVLLTIDLDGFKEVNDTFGHSAGDSLLVAVGTRLAFAVTSFGGMAARIGGDEFGVILPGPMDDASTADFCRSLLDDLREPVTNAVSELHPRGSIGTAAPHALNPRRPLDPEALMRAAEYALYQAKLAGKNTFRIYDSDMAEQERLARDTREAMPAALAAGEFCVEYQPQVLLETGALHGFEALLRWRRDNVLVPPAQFIGIAEETGFILELDRFVLRTALAEAARWAQIAGSPVTIGVNLSALHFRSPEIEQHVADALRQTGVDPGHVTLEITESVLIDDWEATSGILRRLAGSGVRIALDDFGTGYSSMSYLRRLAVHEVKIDRSFVQDVETSDQTRMILDGLVDIVRALDMRLVVEGIETAGQARLIRDIGGQIGQGYHFGRSMPAAEARTFVLAHQNLAVPA